VADQQQQSVVGVYDSMDAAEDAVQKLHENDFPVAQISIVSQDLQSERKIHGFISAGDVARTGAGVGAWTGGIFGLLVGAAFVWVPGVGPLLVAGPLAAALLGGIEGAAAGGGLGGLLGGLMGWGVSKQHIPKYEDRLKGGKYLLVAHGSAEEVKKAQEVLEGTEKAELEHHAEASASS
jgi:uncharacterized membrane protein